MLRRLPVLMLFFVLLVHMFLGQNSGSSALILCLNEDCAIAAEASDKAEYGSQIKEPTHQASSRCCDDDDCQDILLAFGHRDILRVSTQDSRFLSAVRLASQLIRTEPDSLHEHKLPQTLAPPPLLAELPLGYLQHRAASAQIQTLKHTVLTL